MQDSSKPYPIQCWEWLSCGKDACKAYRSDDLRCWLVGDSSCFDESLRLTERLSSRCASCPVFIAHRRRSLGKRCSDQAVIDTMEALLAESLETASKAERVEAESRSKSAQVTLLSEVGRALQGTMEIDELLMVILTAVTAGDGLGFNRAFLLLVDERSSTIRGQMAVGPTHPSEADVIWKAMEIEGKSLREILSTFSVTGRIRNQGIMKIAKKLSFPLADKHNVIARSLNEGKSYVLEKAYGAPEAREVARVLGNEHFLVVPLVAKGRKLGAIIADNFVTKRRIRIEDVRLLETFASQAALAILNASLHKNLQERLRQLEEAHEQLSQNHLQLLRAERLVALGGLAASFIHELRAPLVSIGLMARSAVSKLAKGDPARESLEKIAGEVIEIEEYLKELARSAGRGAKETEPIDISSLVRSSLELMRGLMIRANIEAVLNFNHGESKVLGNMVEFRQMILNLLHNAVEAMPDGGKLTVETGLEEGLLRILIKDTGLGIPEEVKSKVFSVFFTTKPEGSGLGLFIAKRIISDYGGKISFESREGTGTCFSILLPVCQWASEAGHTKAQ